MNLVSKIITETSRPVVLLLHTDQDPSAEEWKAHEEELAQLRQKRHAAFVDLRLLVFTDGGAPTITQRRSLYGKVLNEGPMKVAIVSAVLSNPFKRSLATAVTWLNPYIKTFIPEDYPRALDYIDLSRDADLIWRELMELQSRTQPCKALARVEAHLDTRVSWI